MNLRPYQSKLKSDVYDALRHNRRVMVQLPTGGGKTVIFTAMIADAVQNSKSVLVLVHRKELVTQICDTLTKIGIRPAVIAAGLPYDHTAQVQIGMVQTLARRGKHYCDLVIVDEAHRSAAKSYRDIIDNHGGKLLGFTATPERLDGRGFTDLYDDLVCGPSVLELVKAGYLCPTKVFVAPISQELSEIKTTAGDYNQGQLAQFMERSRIYGHTVGSYRKHCDGAKCISFAASLKLAEEYAAEYNEAGIPAAWVSGDTPTNEREQRFAAFREGRIRVLVNVALATEGLDVPDCDAVQLLRPTKSIALYLQMVGRALRISPNKKHAIILDHAGATIQHGPAEHPRIWTLEGRRTREKQELPPLVKVEPINDPQERKGPEHIETEELIYLPPNYLDPLPAALRAAMDYSPDPWATYAATHTVTKATAEAWARLKGLPRRWVYEQLTDNILAFK